MSPELTLAPLYTVTLVLAGAGGTLELLPPPAAIQAELQPILRGPKGDAGSALSSYPAAAALSGHVAVTLDALGQAVAADCRTAAHAATVLGATTGAAAAGADATVMSEGFLTSPGWGLTPGLPVYLGEAGALVQVVPPSALFIKPLGYAVSSTAVLIDLQPAIFLT